MRIYNSPIEAYQETKRELWEMGHTVLTQSKQNEVGFFQTKELVCYGFQISDYVFSTSSEKEYLGNSVGSHLQDYVECEFKDRTSFEPRNPGTSWKKREELWKRYLQADGTFHYTYSERYAVQLRRIIEELTVRPGTRQAILTMHSNVNTCKGSVSVPALNPDYQDEHTLRAYWSEDLHNMGGVGRIPCSMYYQFFRRNGKLDMAYVMRSCDFLTHHPIDISLALRLQRFVADRLNEPCGMFTYFTGSLHAFFDDMEKLGIF